MTTMKNKNDNRRYDVIICGAGLAGLTLALQLKQQLPELGVAVVDRLKRPLPQAAFKVGESLVETGSHYLAGVLQLGEYLDRSQYRKMGFRFFFDNGNGLFHRRSEFGLHQFPGVNSYQIDRGILENDLRAMIEEKGVVLYEGYIVRDIELADGDGEHLVHIEVREERHVQTLTCRWVVDAMGRRRYLQKRLGLSMEHGEKCSAAWFRMPSRVDVTSFVPPAQGEWHQRVPSGERYYSTNHLMGNGYWVWLIPLSSGTTSIGIVALDSVHHFTAFNTYKAAFCWLQEHEPALAEAIAEQKPMDFRCMRQYSYASRQLFSRDRWACIGEASLFADPFYALASDLIGFENCSITEMVRLDGQGQLTDEIIDYYNRFVLGMNYWLTSNIQMGYPYFGHPVIMACKVLWDTAGGWSMLGPQMFNRAFIPGETQQTFRRISGSYFFLTRTMQQLFADWAERSVRRLSYDFIDFLSIPLMKELQMRNLRPGKSPEEIISDQRRNVKQLETLAQAIFLVAVEDVMPERLEELTQHVWLNAWSVTLNAEKWQTNGLFQPRTEPGALLSAREQIRTLFHTNGAR